LSLMVEAQQAFQQNPSLRAKAHERQELLDSCGVTQVPDIHRRATHIVGLALATNVGGWFIWLLPIAAAVTAVEWWVGWVRRLVGDVLASPNAERILATSEPAFA